MKSTKQVVAEATQALMARSPENNAPSPIGLNKFALGLVNELERQFGSGLTMLEGLVAIGYATARYSAVGVVETVKTKEDLIPQIQMIAELVNTTMRMGLETAWTHAHEARKESLLITVPGGPKA